MNRLLWIFLIWAIALFNSASAQAGQWRIKEYRVEVYGEDQSIQQDQYGVIRQWLWSSSDPGVAPKKEILTMPNNGQPIGSRAELSYLKHSGTGIGNLPASKAVYSLLVTPVFEWQGGENESPTKEIFYSESCSVFGWGSHYGNYGFYPPLSPWDGSQIQYSEKNPWNVPLNYMGNVNTDGEPGANTRTYSYHTTKWTRIVTSSTTAFGKSRQFLGKINSSGANISNQLEFFAGVEYRASMESFDFNVSTDLRSLIKNEPRDKELEAYADKNWTNTWYQGDEEGAGDKPIEFFWDGLANYGITASPVISQSFGTNPIYKWKTGSKWAGVESSPTYQGIVPPQLLKAEPTQQELNEGQTESRAGNPFVDASTPSKSLHHDLGGNYDVQNPNSYEPGRGFGNSPRTTMTRVMLQGGTMPNGQPSEQGILTAKAKIHWSEKPHTQYDSTTEFDIFDMETGEELSLSDVFEDEESQIDDYIKEITDKKNETLETGKFLVKTALEAEMMVGSWYVPEKEDIILGVGGKVLKTIRAAKVLIKLTESVRKYGDETLEAAKAARRLQGKSDNLLLRVRSKVIESGRFGKGAKDANRIETPDAEKVAKGDEFFGEFCFVKGTLISTKNGLRSIETLKTGDLVWAKDEATSKIELKPITHTFERKAPATLVLTFSNGEQVETTVEHPFYVEGKGFTPAGLVAIGNSIVTRAGPAVAIASIEKKAQAKTVYNFTVADFHTYFVGKTLLWTHNLTCKQLLEVSRAYGDGFKNAGKAQRPVVVTAIEFVLKDGRTTVSFGRNKNKLSQTEWDALIDDRVRDLYANVPSSHRGPNHGDCAEMMALTGFLQSGYSLDDIKSVTNIATQVAGPTSRKGGTPWSACDSCTEVLAQFGLTDLGKILRGFS